MFRASFDQIGNITCCTWQVRGMLKKINEKRTFEFVNSSCIYFFGCFIIMFVWHLRQHIRTIQVKNGCNVLHLVWLMLMFDQI